MESLVIIGRTSSSPVIDQHRTLRLHHTLTMLCKSHSAVVAAAAGFSSPCSVITRCRCRSRSLSISSCSLRTHNLPIEPLIFHCNQQDDLPPSLSSSSDRLSSPDSEGNVNTNQKKKKKKKRKKKQSGGVVGISGIHVPRQKYICITKTELVDAIISMFQSEGDRHGFLRVSRYLDSVLHAEHKGMLEDMHNYYALIPPKEQDVRNGVFSTKLEYSVCCEHLDSNDSLGVAHNGAHFRGNGRCNGTLYVNDGLESLRMPTSANEKSSGNDSLDSRVVLARFRSTFQQLLCNAQFEELSARDLMLADALNNDYLLTLPIYVDWKKASESNAMIFKRGYASERQKGRLIAEKLDYLQSKLLQEIFFAFSKPIKEFGNLLNKAVKGSDDGAEMDVLPDKLKLWLNERFPQHASRVKGLSDDQLDYSQRSDGEVARWLAAEREVPSYEGFLSSKGPRERLLRKLLTWAGVIPPIRRTPFDLDKEAKYAENSMSSNFLPRVTLNNLWEPATREFSENNSWKMFKTAFSIFFSKSVLQEPAFQELVLLFTEETQSAADGRTKVLPLQLKIYEKIPIPDLAVIFPNKKLSFRILDTVRLDIASILGLLAFFVNYKFVNIASSPSAFLLDGVAIAALLIYVTRAFLGYKQTRDRYKLLVNKTLYEKTVASGFGSVHFLLDASEQQQFKEAVLVYALLLNSDKYQVWSRKTVADACERFMYDNFKEKITMPIDNAMHTLLRLGLVTELTLNGNVELQALPCQKACNNLKRRWEELLGQNE